MNKVKERKQNKAHPYHLSVQTERAVLAAVAGSERRGGEEERRMGADAGGV